MMYDPFLINRNKSQKVYVDGFLKLKKFLTFFAFSFDV